MSGMYAKLKELRKSNPIGYWADRILGQLEYASKISRINDGKYDALLDTAINHLYYEFLDRTAIDRELAQTIENMISELSEPAKKYHVICAAHAHIDMNWMWRWDETVAVTLDTFRTMLDLMNEYPNFTFSQSQASVYKIVEKCAPSMLQEIKKRVKEGRWEVTAATWVEADKNMPNSESMARHILYTKRYLSNLLDIDSESLNLDFEPDTFGHSLNVPEILSKGGIKYYYHCRGYDSNTLYKWQSPSGSNVLVYREPLWYNSDINSSIAVIVPESCQKHNMDTMLKVYGVGDHGGGPTRRDLERIIDMNTWPVFPQIRFGTFREYFAKAEEVADLLPVVKEELNFVFTGCYTSQSRIKKANRIAEATMNEAETFSTLASHSASFSYPSKLFEDAWHNILFNQFHDILPGSCTMNSREYAMGLFQNSMALANSQKSLAIRSIADQIDTTGLNVETPILKDSLSEGAGAGFGINEFKIMQGERGIGRTRIFHLFNSSSFDREEAAELIIWDWDGDVSQIVFKDSEGNVVDHQLLDHGFNNYWGHRYMRVLIKAFVPSCGYNTYVLTSKSIEDIPNSFPQDHRVNSPNENEYILENQFVRVTFDSVNASIRSLFDKTTGEELIDQEKTSAVFRLIQEDDNRGMTSWIVGRHMNITPLTSNVKINRVTKGSQPIRQSISYQVEYSQSTLKVTVSLDYNSPRLNFDIECDWHEIGRKDEGIPQLSFHMPISYPCSTYKYDIPAGTIERKGLNDDVPANSWALAVRKDSGKKSIMIITDSKYGFRCTDQSMSVTLIRSSFNPDPYPELGIHKIKFALDLVENSTNKALINNAYAFTHPLNMISSRVHSGSLPMVKSFIALEEGNVAVSAVKMPENAPNNKNMIIRIYETEGNVSDTIIRLFQKPSNAYFVDINENAIPDLPKPVIEGDKIRFSVSPYSVVNVCVEY